MPQTTRAILVNTIREAAHPLTDALSETRSFLKERTGKRNGSIGARTRSNVKKHGKGEIFR
jgi:hypothetical protein